MPLKDGFAVARAACELRLAVPLVFLTMHKDEHYLHAALDLGVKGYVLNVSHGGMPIRLSSSTKRGSPRIGSHTGSSL